MKKQALLTILIILGIMGLNIQIFGEEEYFNETGVVSAMPLTELQVKNLDKILLHATIADIHTMVREKKLTYETLTRYYLKRIEMYDEKLHSIISLNPYAIQEAQKKDKNMHKKGGQMYGIPVLLKDNISTKNIRTTAGALILKDFIPSEDAYIVKALHEHGAIILGKTNLSEWANALTLSESPHGFSAVGGQTYNPYDIHFEVGGSSSGSAVAVAAEFATVAIGTETTGSIIHPSLHNGIYGLRPSDGLVSKNLVIPFTQHFDTVGPMTRHPDDMLIVLNALMGYDNAEKSLEGEHAVLSITAYSYEPIGIVNNLIGFPQVSLYAPNMTKEQWEALADIFDFLNIHTEFITLDVSRFMEDASDIHITTMMQGVKHDINAYFNELHASKPVTALSDIIDFNHAHEYEAIPYGQSFFERALKSSVESQKIFEDELQATRIMAQDAINEILESHQVSFLIYSGVGLIGYQLMGGYPVLNVPLGYEVGGHPINMSIMGKKFTDVALINVAQLVKKALAQAPEERRALWRKVGFTERKRPESVF